MTGIYGFVGQYRFLSNFFIEPDGTHVEGEFQRDKCIYPQDRLRFHEHLHIDQPLMSPVRCKRLGRSVPMRKDWEDVKVDIMMGHVRRKFQDHETLGRWLKETRPLYLEETNDWGDRYWGVCGGKGLNMLGYILIQVRDHHL